MNILQINASARRDGNSTRIANAITARLKALHPSANVVVRNLATDPHPILDEPSLAALFTPADKRTPEQAARVALDDALIAQLQAADVVVLGVPMYNFGVSVQLKSWIDAIARAGVTFRYTENGSVGLLKNKKVYAGLARGGRHRDLPEDTQVPYLRTMLGFIGITDVTFIYAEGLNMGPEAAAAGFATAEAEIAASVA